MGMFDTIICEYPLPDGYDKQEFQSKDFDCQLDTYKITAEGELKVFLYGVEPAEESQWKRVNERWESVGYRGTTTPYHGIFNFYGGTWSNQLQEHTDGWHEYVAKFTDGKLVEITVAGPREIHQERKDILEAIEEVMKEHS